MRTFAALLWLAALVAAALWVPDRLALPFGAAAAAAGFGLLLGARSVYQRLALRQEALAEGAEPAALPPLGLTERLLGLRDDQAGPEQCATLRAWTPRILGLAAAAGLLGLGGVLMVVQRYME